ncbi:hypothetical protein [Phaeobacter inhibens]|uniref:hypothetical protein n=1 Tax=Phaeobacter inhibens TaxID=221822 RepID=UPI0021A2B04E|nr:hypothetical protein [Phaeobacter inhibens]
MQAELVQDMVGIGFWSIDADGQTPYWSPKVYEIHGVKTRGVQSGNRQRDCLLPPR